MLPSVNPVLCSLILRESIAFETIHVSNWRRASRSFSVSIDLVAMHVFFSRTGLIPQDEFVDMSFAAFPNKSHHCTNPADGLTRALCEASLTGPEPWRTGLSHWTGLGSVWTCVQAGLPQPIQ